MKNIKFIVLIIVILIIGVLVFILNTNTKEENKDKQFNQQIASNIQNNSIETKEVTNSAMYFTIKSCIDTYMKYLSEHNKEAIYSVLSLDYIQDNNIDVDNVLNHVQILDGRNIDFTIHEMRVENEDKDIQTYYINGVIRSNNSNKQAKMTINIDITNKVFNVIPDVIEGVFDE